MIRKFRKALTSILAVVCCVAPATRGQASTKIGYRLPSPRSACLSCRIVDLSAIVGGGAIDLIPTAINNADQIVGYDGGPGTNGNAGAAYLINPDLSFAKFGRSGIDDTLYVPTAISNSGKSVVGDAFTFDAFNGIEVEGVATWTLGARSFTQNYVNYDSLVDPAIQIASDNLPVAGVFYYGFTSPTLAKFPSSGCSITDFSARAINDFGTIVGSGGGYAAYGSTTACATPINLPRPANGFTQAHAINSVGDLLVSFTGPAAPAFGAEYLVRGGRFYRVALPLTFPSSSTYLVARGINDGDEIVGDVMSQTPPFASVAPFLYRDGTSIDLNAFLPKNSGWTLLTAAGVSAGGEVVGTGYHDGVLRGYALQT